MSILRPQAAWMRRVAPLAFWQIFMVGFFLLLGGLVSDAKQAAREAGKPGEFESFIAALWPDAAARGISRKTFEAAFAGVTPDPAIIALTHKQSEFVKPIWSYLDDAVAPARLARGRAVAERYADELVTIERRFGVDRRVILGIWGMETSFGAFTGDKDVIRSLATLAFERYRGDFFRDELLVALKLLEEKQIRRQAMRGSWAGAMGQTQFMPSSFQKYAVDQDGDGARDLWETIPDALASTANYLAQFGWEAGVPWGIEVTLPANFDLASALEIEPFPAWRRRGLAPANGAELPRKGQARLYLPAGIKGPAFLITENYKVIKQYNSSDAYALGVAHLGDRLLGGEAIRKPWPRSEKRLSGDEVKEIQRKLTQLGYPIGKIDGRVGEISRQSIRAHQIKLGLPADGYPNPALLARLRGNKGANP